MLNFEEELKKFKPSLEVEDIENAVYQEDLSDMTDILREMMDQSCPIPITIWGWTRRRSGICPGQLCR